jgi:hypothetical protein
MKGLLLKVCAIGVMTLVPCLNSLNIDEDLLSDLLRGKADTKDTLSSLKVSGTSKLYGNTQVGKSTDNANLTVYGDISASGNATITGNAAITGTAAVTGASTLTGTTTVGTKRIFGCADFNPQAKSLAIDFTSDTGTGAILNLDFVTTPTYTHQTLKPVIIVHDTLYIHPNSTSQTEAQNGTSGQTVVTRPAISGSGTGGALTITCTYSYRRTATGVERPGNQCISLAMLNSTTACNTTTEFFAAATTSPVNTGKIFYEVIGDNVVDVAITNTWDRSMTTASQIVSGLTVAQIQELIAALQAVIT